MYTYIYIYDQKREVIYTHTHTYTHTKLKKVKVVQRQGGVCVCARAWVCRGTRENTFYREHILQNACGSVWALKRVECY